MALTAAANMSGAIVAFLPADPDTLTVPDGDPAEQLHITLLYLTDDNAELDEEQRQFIAQALADVAPDGPIEATVTGVQGLGEDDPQAIVLMLDSPELQTMRETVKAALADGIPVPEDRFPEYLPHLTIGYGIDPDALADQVGTTVVLDRLAAMYGPDHEEIPLTAAASPVVACAERSMMPRRWNAVLARIGVPTGDGRILAPGAITSRDLPLPLSWQRQSADGHWGSVVVGRIESISVTDDMVTASGSLLSEDGWQVIEHIEAGVIGPSVDLDDLEYVIDDQDRAVITRGRIAGATLVAIPAFADVSINLMPLPAPPPADEPVWDEYDELVRTAYEPAYAAKLAMFAAARTERPAFTDSLLPSLEWFTNPGLTSLTPLSVTPDGRVYGHVAGWDSCHVGLPGCVTPPTSQTGYSYFMVGEQCTAEGTTVPVGTLTVGGGHADPQLGFRAAAEHYDDIGTAVARVFAGEDEHGIWVSGWVLPDADPVRVEQFKASPVSGDWRRIGGSLELIAVCSVNTPGFPVPRTLVKFAAGAQRALIGTFGPMRGRVVEGAEPAPAATMPEAEPGPDSTEARAKWARAVWNERN
ncbi:phage minor capsid protein [Streptomyces sp. L-9-10]|uniref:2'-5' RNA ligase family protein n=1 Tax=Streptomyces sp. L-9-10 TaxID=1478131 RepID=UPI00101C0ED1|nr:2'-5' RNA ligase family protein [Streptomyces sp. L-9-10]RYJ26471.1 phage minor capsid protein [Streptomyces sp. L-9-10]